MTRNWPAPSYKLAHCYQEIQDYCGQSNRVDARVRFPRGFITTAEGHRRLLPNITIAALRTNLGYALMANDLLRWLANRTDLSRTALEMVIKENICLLGSICEAMTIRKGIRGLGSKRTFVQRTERLVELQVIDCSTKTDLDWVWEIRCREHLVGVSQKEWDLYTRTDHNRAMTAFELLRDRLRQNFG